MHALTHAITPGSLGGAGNRHIANLDPIVEQPRLRLPALLASQVQRLDDQDNDEARLPAHTAYKHAVRNPPPIRSGACGGLSGRNAKKTRVTFVALAWDRTVRRERFPWLLIQAPSPEQQRDVRLDKQRLNLGQG